jgi:8-oxo-dGTP diphosphatase
MQAGDAPTRELMRDIKAVDWLPLDAAIARLSRGYERAFLEQVGPIALAAATGGIGVTLPETVQPIARERKPDRTGFLQKLLRLFR